jgi:hypothetical protein
VVQRLLEGSPTVLSLFRGNPFPDGPPVAIRIGLYMLQPASLDEWRRTGVWWRRRYLGPHLPEATRNDALWNDWLPSPEQFHPDELIWKLRSPRLRTLFDRARSGRPPEEAVVDPSAGITADDVDLFWSRIVDAASEEERRDWKDLPAVLARIRQDLTHEQLRVLERVLGRLGLALLARLEPHLYGQREPILDVPTFFHGWMLIGHIIAQGKETFDAVYRDPTLAANHVSAMTNETGLFLTAVFWHEKLAFHARKFRLLLRFCEPDFGPSLPGFLLLIPFLARHFETPGEEHPPSFVRRIADGEWVLVDEEEEGR